MCPGTWWLVYTRYQNFCIVQIPIIKPMTFLCSLGKNQLKGIQTPALWCTFSDESKICWALQKYGAHDTIMFSHHEKYQCCYRFLLISLHSSHNLHLPHMKEKHSYYWNKWTIFIKFRIIIFTMNDFWSGDNIKQICIESLLNTWWF